MEIRRVAVIGLGTMGAGIAEVFARRGLPVTAVEVNRQALDRGIAALGNSLERAVARGKLTEAEGAEVAGRVRPASQLTETADADLIIEVVPEDLAIKRQVLAELDRACRPDAIIATNTSSLSVTAIAAGSAHPGRVVGMHFFNPAPVMRLVEIVTTMLTSTAVAEAVTRLARDLGKTPVVVSDRAGFIANALLLPYLNHAARLAGTGYATRGDIDLAMTAGAGLPMGPLALLDLIGLDTSLAVLDVLHAEFGGTRYQPAPLLRRLVQAGRTGRKSGAGLFEYPASRPAPAGESAGIVYANHSADPGTITLIGPRVSADTGERPGAGGPGPDSAGTVPGDLAAELDGLLTAAGLRVSRDPAEPSELVILAARPLGGVLEAAVAAGRAADVVGLHLPGPAAGRSAGQPGLAELVVTRLTSKTALAASQDLVTMLGLRAVRVPDRPGLLVGALLFPHMKDALAMIEDGYASAADIDTAMRLGCGYARGPVELLQDAGYQQVLDVLRAMHRGYGDPAFAPPPLLADLAATGQPLLDR